MTRTAVLLAVLTSLIVAAPAAAVTVPDAVGDARTGDAGHDITGFEWSYDAAAGTATGTVVVRGAGADAGIVMGFGPAESDGSCAASDALALITVKSDSRAAWQRAENGQLVGTPQAASRSGDATTFTVSATAAELANRPYACAEVDVTSTERSTDVYDSASLSTPPPPAPAPTPPAPAPTPTPTPAPPAAAELRAALGKVPARVKRGGAFRTRLTVRNTGTAPSARATVRVGGARGLRVTPRKLSIPALAPGRSASVRLRVATGRAVRARTPLVLTVRAGGVSATARKVLRLPAKRKPKPKPKPTTTTGGLAGTFWWWNEPRADRGWNLYALRFYGNGYAYYRLPDDEDQTAPRTCTAVTATPDEDGDYDDSGCVRWSLRGGRLSITDGKLSATLRGGRLRVKREGDSDTIEAERVREAKPGQRVQLTLEHRDFFGFCGGITTCSTTFDQVTLQKDGQFGKVDSSLTTSGDAGGGGGLPFIAVGQYPADKRGTYEVLPGFRIRLSYANGVTKVFPFGFTREKESDGKVGFILGENNYYPDPTPDDD